MSGRRKPWHSGTYHVRARHCREVAYANPETRCRRCGLSYLEGVHRYGERGARWDAGHVNDGQTGGPLAAEHAACNRSAGAERGNRMREPRSEDPYR